MNWREFTALLGLDQENVHRDDYLIRDTKARGENVPVEYHDGMMCTDLANLILFANLNLNASDQDYFHEIRQEACQHRALISPHNEPVVTVDIELDALIERPDLPWQEVLPEETYHACPCICSSRVFRGCGERKTK